MACFLDQMGRDGLVDARCFTHNFSGSTRCTKLERVSLFSQPFVRHSRFWYALSLGIQWCSNHISKATSSQIKVP